MLAVVLTPTVKFAGNPAEIGVVGAVIVIPVRGAIPMVTSAVFPATLAVTLAARVVDCVDVNVSVVVATPDESVGAVEGFSEPLSVVNVTGMPDSPVPDTSSTRAVIVDVPPVGATVCGLAPTTTRSTPAAPTFRFSSLPDAPPENAVIVATPL